MIQNQYTTSTNLTKLTKAAAIIIPKAILEAGQYPSKIESTIMQKPTRFHETIIRNPPK